MATVSDIPKTRAALLKATQRHKLTHQQALEKARARRRELRQEREQQAKGG